MKNEIRKISERAARAVINTSGFAASLGRLAVTVFMVICASSAAWAQQGLPLKSCPPQTGQFYICQNDIVVADATAGTIASSWTGTTGALFLIDPKTGVQTLISQGGLLQQTVGVVVADDGALVATDRITGVIRVDPKDGSQSYIYQANPMLNDFFGITKDSGGNFIVTDTGWDPTTPYPTSANKRNLNTQGRVLRIDKTTHVATPLWQAAPLANPFGVALDPNDFSIIVSDMNAYNKQGGIFRISSGLNPTVTVVWGPSGNGQQVTQTSPYNCPLGITVLGGTGDIVATVFNFINSYGCAQPRPGSGNTGNIFRVDLTHNVQVPFVNIANFDWLQFPFGITQEASQNVIFVDEGNVGVYRLDLSGNLVPCQSCASATWDSGLVLSGGFPAGTRPDVPNSLASPVGISYAISQPPPAVGIAPQTATATSLTSAPNPSVYNVAVSLTATVTASPASAAVNEGTVTFYEGSTQLCLSPVVSGMANCSPGTPLSVGTHSITASYVDGSTGNFGSSSSTAVSQVVNRRATTSTVTFSSNPTALYTPVTVTVTVADSDAGTPVAPTGTVTITSGESSDGSTTCSLTPGTSSSSCSWTFTPVVPNGRFITASYGGDTKHFPSDDKTQTSATLMVTADQLSQQVCLSAPFNGTAIAGGNTIWFNSVFQALGKDITLLTHITFYNQTIQIGSGTSIAIPDVSITFDPSASSPVSNFNATTNTWQTTFPTTDLKGEYWLGGTNYTVPAAGLPGGTKPVAWCGTFSSDRNVKIAWEWGAAVYKTFNTDLNALGVKPVDDKNASQYKNSDRAGTPENYKSSLIAGARGNGGANFTGSYTKDDPTKIQ
jgi:hypothetical protein